MGEGKPNTEVLSLRWLGDRELLVLCRELEVEVKSLCFSTRGEFLHE